ncbi:PIR Superfamily Protein [Plasmodium ovale wallikeri]|uniref:PIR Superfamily Protein n=1 Tax=Plasmodium ovale wallikeri TaxID=864142 RepID=A0A1A9ACH3_PLAOA|nr:PIR Superfamily Protein [Plasmodium ovale wallikeri]SBT56955.1 PIR Superfamily Protein [Plasmodium ovale wallikeri]
MSEPKVDSALKSLRDDHTFQKNPDIQKFYNELESTCDNNISYSCKKEIPNKEEINENVKNFYHKISENRSKLLVIKDNFSVFKGDLPKRCMYFKYWFYDQAIANEFDNKQIEQIFKLFEDLNKIEFFITHQRDNNDFTDSADSTWFTCKIHYFILDDIKKLKFKSGDSYQKSKYLCDELDEFKKIHHINELHKMQCNVEDESLSRGVQQARSSSPTTNVNVNRTISASLSTVALFGIFSFLYKLTPFGPWIRNHVLSTRKSLFKANEENTEELPENLLDYVDTNSQRDNHNIGYNAV